MIPAKETVKRRVIKWLVNKICRWDRLCVVMFALESMPSTQRESAIGKILSTYYPASHVHRNTRKKVTT
jgi:hypothetical protein